MKESEDKPHYIKYIPDWCWHYFRFTSRPMVVRRDTWHENAWSTHSNVIDSYGDDDVFLHCTIWIRYPYYDKVNNKIFSIPTNWFEGMWSDTWRLHPGFPKYPRRALHLSGSEARFSGVHFFGPSRFSPLMTFWDFFSKFGYCGPKLP